MIRLKWLWKHEPSEWERWFAAQLDALHRGGEIIPPWLAFPGEDPWWGGWRQGNSEGWLVAVWLPFWRNLDDKGKAAYVEKWDASADWREYLMTWKPPSGEHSSPAEHVLNLHRFE